MIAFWLCVNGALLNLNFIVKTRKFQLKGFPESSRISLDNFTPNINNKSSFLFYNFTMDLSSKFTFGAFLDLFWRLIVKKSFIKKYNFHLSWSCLCRVLRYLFPRRTIHTLGQESPSLKTLDNERPFTCKLMFCFPNPNVTDLGKTAGNLN